MNNEIDSGLIMLRFKFNQSFGVERKKSTQSNMFSN